MRSCPQGTAQWLDKRGGSTLNFQLRHLFIPQRKRNVWHFGRRRVGCGALRTPSIAEEESGRGVRPGEDVSSAATAANRAGARSRELPAARCTASSSTGGCKPREGGMGRNKFVDIRAPCRPGDRPLVVTALALYSLLFPFSPEIGIRITSTSSLLPCNVHSSWCFRCGLS